MVSMKAQAIFQSWEGDTHSSWFELMLQLQHWFPCMQHNCHQLLSLSLGVSQFGNLGQKDRVLSTSNSNTVPEAAAAGQGITALSVEEPF